MEDKDFLLKIVTPKECIGPFSCDSVKLSITDGKRQKEAGSYGIRKGHAEAVFALEKGKLTALKDGKEIFSFETSKGFATVCKDVVTVTVSNISKK